MNYVIPMMILAISNPYILTAIGVGIFIIAFFLIPILSKKFPNLFTTIVKIFSNKDLIRVSYYAIAEIALKDVTKEEKDLIFEEIAKNIQLAEDLAACASIPMNERKDYVMKATKDLMKTLDIEMTAQVESFISSAIEMIVNYPPLKL